ncbi:MAG TPA: dolichyl-phosphate beta-D-mannosyltransferase [Myxococcales bacterium]|nr:dolichyl-phosphate beta-D-mannosyltransferase [Myxococcales bacterium]HBU47206.1 dolichyl-phosphate beta-D-mannosyltransferase [Myxococcales bacterium]|tara:strand:+ start:95 stop:802 length:708 start_codon:yes stop_codon:yes gene_type:complete
MISRPLVCMPTYNEMENIESIIPAVLAAAPVDILIIDDNSPDGTGERVAQMAESEPRLHLLAREGKGGLGPAYLAGFQWGLERDYDALIEMDADFSHRPRYLPDMLATLEEADVAVGSRWVPGGGVENWGLSRRLISRGGSLYARTLLGVKVRDLTAGFVGWRADVLRQLDLSSVAAKGYVFQIEMKYRALRGGYRVQEFPIVFPDRVAGESKMSSGIVVEAMLSVWGLRSKVRS